MKATDARAQRQENAKLMRVATGELLRLCQERDEVLAALIWKLRKSPPGEDPAGLN